MDIDNRNPSMTILPIVCLLLWLFTRENRIAVQLAEVMQVCLDTESMERAARCAREVGRAFAGELSAVANRTFVDICMTGNDKGTGVARLLEQMGWQDEEICVIGDDRNDLSMIERFHGFAVARGNDAVKPAASQVFESVGDMLRARMEAEVRR